MADVELPIDSTTAGVAQRFLDGYEVTNGNGKVVIRTRTDVGASSVTITTGQADNSAFTAGVSIVAPIAGVYDDDATNITDGDVGGIRSTKNRELYTADAAALTLAVAQQTSTSSSAAITGAPLRVTRHQVTITNSDSTNSIWVGNTGVTKTTGVLIAKGGQRVFRTKAALFVVDDGSNRVLFDVQDEYD